MEYSSWGPPRRHGRVLIRIRVKAARFSVAIVRFYVLHMIESPPAFQEPSRRFERKRSFGTAGPQFAGPVIAGGGRRVPISEILGDSVCGTRVAKRIDGSGDPV